MTTFSKAQEIGKRCRRFRNALGWSQQELADKVNTTAQNISKYEKEGISNIDMVYTISDALGQNLLIDENEEEGNVGDIGKEILAYLIGGKRDHENLGSGYIGYCDADCILGIDQEYLFDKDFLCGMPPERRLKELFKLEQLGLCVREQYVNYSGDNKDVVFITAKGVIRFRHIAASIGIHEWKDEIRTYEQICDGYDCYQSYITAHPLQRRIRELYQTDAFRNNFVRHIIKHYQEGLGEPMQFQCAEHFPGRNCYSDILYSMMTGFTREEAVKLMKEKGFGYWNISRENEESEEDTVLGGDLPELDFIYQVCDLIDGDVDEMYADHCDFLYGKTRKGNGCTTEDADEWEDAECEDYEEELEFEGFGDYEESEDYEDEEDDGDEEEYAAYDPISDLKERFWELYEQNGGGCPIDWFTKEDIEAFIRENILPPANEREIALEKKLIQIMREYPEITKRYFEFSEVWERNGLADLLRTIYKVPKKNEFTPKEETPALDRKMVKSAFSDDSIFL